MSHVRVISSCRFSRSMITAEVIGHGDAKRASRPAPSIPSATNGNLLQAEEKVTHELSGIVQLALDYTIHRSMINRFFSI